MGIHQEKLKFPRLIKIKALRILFPAKTKYRIDFFPIPKFDLMCKKCAPLFPGNISPRALTRCTRKCASCQAANAPGSAHTIFKSFLKQCQIYGFNFCSALFLFARWAYSTSSGRVRNPISRRRGVIFLALFLSLILSHSATATTDDLRRPHCATTAEECCVCCESSG